MIQILKFEVLYMINTQFSGNPAASFFLVFCSMSYCKIFAVTFLVFGGSQEIQNLLILPTNFE
jgi:hypothetical protein